MGNPIGKFMDSDNLIFGIGQVSKITGVSSRSLRYWESQGYISTLKSDNDKQTSRQYNVQNLLKIFRIKHFQDEGYTLQGAVEKALKLQAQLPIIKTFMEKQIQDIIIEEDRGVIDFGFCDSSQKQRIIGIVDRDANTHFEIRDV
ncbi:MerR family transcriptional regulator [Lentilactobacillus senioris]|uniref:MerR family transcriptional regulator n=1 Tax=Lentilactobacillus senioris TaxID=931534 RepID=UPI002282ABEA|nr:MerR family transcriptional regulator [Lentilactobacillus senioris]MCY9806258.1 MerR family transcriptional regulator [Lentilactobacillus senioris]